MVLIRMLPLSGRRRLLPVADSTDAHRVLRRRCMRPARPTPDRARRSLTCPSGLCQVFGFDGVGSLYSVGGAWARWRVGVCPRTPRLTSVLDSGWLRVG